MIDKKAKGTAVFMEVDGKWVDLGAANPEIGHPFSLARENFVPGVFDGEGEVTLTGTWEIANPKTLRKLFRLRWQDRFVDWLRWMFRKRNEL